MKEFLEDLKKADAIEEFNSEDELFDMFKTSEEYEVEYDIFLAGSFDSPGYDADYYVLAYIDENGKIQGSGFAVESY